MAKLYKSDFPIIATKPVVENGQQSLRKDIAAFRSVEAAEKAGYSPLDKGSYAEIMPYFDRFEYVENLEALVPKIDDSSALKADCDSCNKMDKIALLLSDLENKCKRCLYG